jgi:hypothetical protein
MNTQQEVRFTATHEELKTIKEIARRAEEMSRGENEIYSLKDWQMTIEACHCNGTPLRLNALLEADDETFGHDVFGIERYLDKDTGKLDPAKFCPRLAMPTQTFRRFTITLDVDERLIEAGTSPAGLFWDMSEEWGGREWDDSCEVECIAAGESLALPEIYQAIEEAGDDLPPLYRAHLEAEGEVDERVDQYLRSSGVCCPVCGSDDIEGGSVEINEGVATQYIRCRADGCGATWTDIYRLVNVEIEEG